MKQKKLTKRLESKEISYEEDIAREVSKDTGLDYEMCLEVQKNIFKFAVEETKNRDIYSINFPYLGVLYLNRILCNSRKRKLHYKCKNKDLPTVEKELDFWKHRIGTMEMYRDDNKMYLQACKHFTLPFQSKFAGMLPKDYLASKYSSEVEKTAEIYSAVEILQNEGYYKDLELIKGKQY